MSRKYPTPAQLRRIEAEEGPQAATVAECGGKLIVTPPLSAPGIGRGCGSPVYVPGTSSKVPCGCFIIDLRGHRTEHLCPYCEQMEVDMRIKVVKHVEVEVAEDVLVAVTRELLYHMLESKKVCIWHKETHVDYEALAEYLDRNEWTRKDAYEVIRQAKDRAMHEAIEKVVFTCR